MPVEPSGIGSERHAFLHVGLHHRESAGNRPHGVRQDHHGERPGGHPRPGVQEQTAAFGRDQQVHCERAVEERGIVFAEETQSAGHAQQDPVAEAVAFAGANEEQRRQRPQQQERHVHVELRRGDRVVEDELRSQGGQGGFRAPGEFACQQEDADRAADGAELAQQIDRPVGVAGQDGRDARDPPGQGRMLRIAE